MAKKLERVVRTRRLTAEEISQDHEIREKVKKEFPPAQFRGDAGAHPLSDALKKAIRKSEKSVYQIAREAGVSPIVISRFLSGERDIRLATADKLAETLELALPKG